MRLASVLILLLFATTSARADEPTPRDSGYLAVGAGVLFDAADSGAGLVAAEGAVRIERTPLSVRGMLGYGDYTADEGTGPYRSARVGIEVDGCVDRLACAFIGLDTGHQWSHWRSVDTGMVTDLSGSMFVFRGGADIGSSILRARFTLERTDSAFGAQFALVHRFY
jgi:hypothetical protein